MFERFYTLIELVFELWVRMDCGYCISSSVHSYLRSISTAVLASVLSHSISISIYTPPLCYDYHWSRVLPYHISSHILSVAGNRCYNEFWLMIYTIGRGGHRIKSAVYFDLRLISTAGGGRPMLIAYKINKQSLHENQDEIYWIWTTVICC